MTALGVLFFSDKGLCIGVVITGLTVVICRGFQVNIFEKDIVEYGMCKRKWNKADECEHMGKDIRAEDSYGF